MSRIVVGSPSMASSSSTKSCALERQQRLERGRALLVALGEDDVLDVDPPVAEELVLGAAQADPLGAPGAGAAGVLGGVGVGAHPHPPGGVGVLHDPVDGVQELAHRVVLAGGERRRPARRRRSA